MYVSCSAHKVPFIMAYVYAAVKVKYWGPLSTPRVLGTVHSERMANRFVMWTSMCPTILTRSLGRGQPPNDVYLRVPAPAEILHARLSVAHNAQIWLAQKPKINKSNASSVIITLIDRSVVVIKPLCLISQVSLNGRSVQSWL